MLQSLFRLLVRPQVTLDELLEERRTGRSVGATFWLILLSVLVNVILIVFVAHKVMGQVMAHLAEGDSVVSPDAVAIAEICIVGAVLLAAVVKYGLSRYVFAWLVQLGVRISAGGQYPRGKEERREKARLLRLIQPYTLWISLLPTLLSLIALTLIVGFSNVPDFFVEPNSSDLSQLTSLVVGVLIWGSISEVFLLGMWVYMIVVRTFAIQKIYRISAARAFWGPFLVYALSYFVLSVLYVVAVVVAQLYGGGSTTSDLNWM